MRLKMLRCIINQAPQPLGCIYFMCIFFLGAYLSVFLRAFLSAFLRAYISVYLRAFYTPLHGL